jgi:hypothetical protein
MEVPIEGFGGLLEAKPEQFSKCVMMKATSDL